MKSWTIPQDGFFKEIRIRIEDNVFKVVDVLAEASREPMERVYSADAFFDPRKPSWYLGCVSSLKDMRRVQQIYRESAPWAEGQVTAKGSKQHVLFWKHFDGSRFRAFKIQSGPWLLKVGKTGVRWFFERADGTFNPSDKQTLSGLWFNGPLHPIAAQKDRARIRQKIFQALSTESGLSLDAAFPLLSYTKFRKKRWEYNVRKGSGEFVAIQATHLDVGGWSPPDQGGSNPVTFEQFMAFPHAHQSIPPKIRKEILTRLERAVVDPSKAIVKKPKKRVFLSIGDCTICSHIGEEEHAFSKYGWDDEGPPYPAAAMKLEDAGRGSTIGKRGYDLKVCPECGCYYLYSHEYEYLANGSEDSIELIRLSPVEAIDLMPPVEYKKRMAQLKTELSHTHPRSRAYAAKSICAEALRDHAPQRIEKLLKRRDAAIRSAVLAYLKQYLLVDDYKLDRSKAKEIENLRRAIWRIGMAGEEAVAQQALKLLRFMEGL